MARSSDKRERLLDAARTLFHTQGFAQTTLADISAASGVPLGNVYYYFKTKDELVEAVAADHEAQFQQFVEELEAAEPSPKGRLLRYLATIHEQRDSLKSHGCPVGTLCLELAKAGAATAEKADAVLRLKFDWLEAQFRAMGRDDASFLTERLLASLQGSALLANALNDCDIICRNLHWSRQWVEAL
ncbi:TetR/AcrR family transcriptional regulator [Parachitinimonas caeni]|uniref:TetR/AcrR family transcriptional regulator n=1 Tax=Parachitinimonas caeni TaxID=3031301 RepID=A0ABT7E1B8_9NEIS|nr:TetR/AcrR family transcriptional regulator [Parachitinimonas caeni]MDK2125200.1 TetR/AcrR family transcriptional regulator [Parachitinimonas caeni]